MAEPFSHPARGAGADYERYLRGMDSSMRQKVALTAAHLLGRGRVADMGMGSGAGSDALAALYPALEVVGVDVDPQMVARARARFTRPNLSFAVGDVAAPLFAPASLDAVFDSSVLHHVTSFGGYRREAAAEALAVQAAALAPHGVLIVRDFVDPGPGEVLLDLPGDDGAEDAADPRAASTAALLERFAREFRSLAPAPGFPMARLSEGAPPGWRRYRLAHVHAAEFLLHKDYRADWVAEVKEEYTYLTQVGFEDCFAGLGLRLLASTPLANPWIVRRRFEGRCALFALDGRPLDFPATNTVVVGERVPSGQGVLLREAGPAGPPTFLALAQHRDRRSGRIMDLARRPGLTVDVLPHFASGGQTFVLARMSYPRPILAAALDRAAPLDGGRAATWVSEPLSVIQTDRPLGETVEEALRARAGIAPSAIRAVEPGARYYPSPGGVQEEVRQVLVEVEPVLVEDRLDNPTGFSSAGRVRAIDACQLLRAAQVGGLPDARLETATYDLLLGRGLDPGPWIGDDVSVAGALVVGGAAHLPERPRRRAFEPAPSGQSPGFLEVRAARFEEVDGQGRVVAAATREYVVPRTLAARTGAVVLLAADADGRPVVALDDDDLPAAQALSGGSELWVTPAWRLPIEVLGRAAARRFVAERLRVEYGVTVADIGELGGRYHPTPGLTPEVVHPLHARVVALDEQATGRRPLTWVQMDAIVRARDRLQDGHLRICLLRAAHALGCLARR